MQQAYVIALCAWCQKVASTFKHNTSYFYPLVPHGSTLDVVGWSFCDEAVQ